MIVVNEHASTVRNRTGKVHFARAMPTTNPRTGMLWERDCSAHRAHGSAHTNVFALENQSERELLITILAGLQCSKRCQFN